MNIRKYTASALLAAMLVTNTGPWVPMALANPIVSDAGRLGPQMDEARNGTTIVNINTPNGRGLSHNQYDAFNIDNKGAILNNANRPVNTELAGYIMGNPNMVGPTATTILNEVTGTGQTNFNGALEVAGNSAHVIIANPNGIAVNNGTFINAQNATLTTGNPILNDGKITGYDVQKGSIAIEGQGLNASKTARTDLLAEAVQLNAKVWAKDTQVVTGQNQISVDANGKVTNVAKTGNSNQVGLDVSALGGMYANSMYLVGTNDGFGVNNQGVLSAQHKITVDSTGRVVNTGTIATQSADIKAESLEQSNKAKFYASDAKLVVNTLDQKDGSTLLTTNKLDMAASKLTNTDHSVLKTEGTLHIGKSVDEHGNIVGKIDSIVNNASTIEAGQGGSILAKAIENRNGGITLKRISIGEPEHIKNEVAPSGSIERYQLSEERIYGHDDKVPEDKVVVHSDENLKLSINGKKYNSWTKYEYDRRKEQDVVDKSDPARIISGGALHLEADSVINDGSQISAAGEMTGTVGHYEQINPKGNEYIIDDGTATGYSKRKRDGWDTTNIREANYHNETVVPKDVPVSVYGGNVADSTTSHTVDTSILNNMSQMATNPNTTYLIETDPNFTNRRNFLSSDYVLQRLKLDPSNVQKRLGDGYYEQQLVMQDIMRQTGKSRLHAGLTAEEQYKRLVDNGIKLSKSQSITLGRGLTESEQEQLKEDVVLLVSKPVVLPDGTTQTVLVPTLYVASTTKRVDGGANLQAKSINLNVDTMHNSGSIVADTDVTLIGNTIHNDNGLIDGEKTQVLAREDIKNTQGTIRGKQETTVYAKQDVINEGGTITQTDSDGELLVAAGRDVINNGKSYEASNNTVTWNSRNNRRETVTGVDQGVIQGAGDTRVLADRDVVMKAGIVSSDKEAIVQGKRNVTMTAMNATHELEEHRYDKGKSGGGNTQITESHDKVKAETIVGSGVEGKNVHIVAGDTIHTEGAQILAAEDAKLMATNVDLNTATANTVIDHVYLDKKKSIAKRESTHATDYADIKTVAGTVVSGKTIGISATKDITGQSVTAIGENDVNFVAGNAIDIGADKQIIDATSTYHHKKSGLLGGAGIGFSIGKERLNTDDASHEEVTAYSTIASTNGRVNLVANDTTHLTSANIISKEGMHLQGAEVLLDGNTDATHMTHNESYKKSGLTVSLGGAAMDAVHTASRTIKRAGSRNDKRLAAFELNEARKQLQDGYKAVDEAVKGAKLLDDKGNVLKGENGKDLRGQKNIDNAINLSVSIGSTSRHQNQSVDTTEYKGGALISDGTVSITSTKSADNLGQGSQVNTSKDNNSTNSNNSSNRNDSSNTKQSDITLIGEDVLAQKLVVDSAHDINLQAGTNTLHASDNYKQSGWSVGANVSLTSGSLLGLEASGHIAKQNGVTEQVSYKPTTIRATELAQLKAKHDTNIIGSKVSGKGVIVDTGNDLHIESLQEVNNFKEHSKSGGFSVSTSPTFKNTIGSISASAGRIDSNWKSVTDQAGIFAGEDGYHVTTGNTTALKGALINSEAPKAKNQLSTKKLVMEDIQNEASYDMKENGIQYNNFGDNKKKSKNEFDKIYKHLGTTPTGTIGARGKASSTTKSAISEGIIQENGQLVDVKTFNTDVDHALNELQTIFDRQKIEERQELANLFSKNANEAIHQIAKQKDWKEGDPRKVALHAMFGGMAAKLGGNKFSDGAIPDGLNEAMMPQFIKMAGTIKGPDGKDYVNPEDLQAISYVFGFAVNKSFGGNPQTGAYVARMGTKHNAIAIAMSIPSMQFTGAATYFSKIFSFGSLVSPVGGVVMAFTTPVATGKGEPVTSNVDITTSLGIPNTSTINPSPNNNQSDNITPIVVDKDHAFNKVLRDQKSEVTNSNPWSPNYGKYLADQGKVPNGIAPDGRTFYIIADGRGGTRTVYSYTRDELDHLPNNPYSRNHGFLLANNGVKPDGIRKSDNITYYNVTMPDGTKEVHLSYAVKDLDNHPENPYSNNHGYWMYHKGYVINTVTNDGYIVFRKNVNGEMREYISYHVSQDKTGVARGIMIREGRKELAALKKGVQGFSIYDQKLTSTHTSSSIIDTIADFTQPTPNGDIDRLHLVRHLNTLANRVKDYKGEITPEFKSTVDNAFAALGVTYKYNDSLTARENLVNGLTEHVNNYENSKYFDVKLDIGSGYAVNANIGKKGASFGYSAGKRQYLNKTTPYEFSNASATINWDNIGFSISREVETNSLDKQSNTTNSFGPQYRGFGVNNDGHTKLTFGASTYVGVGGGFEASVDVTNISRKFLGYNSSEDEEIKLVKSNLGRS